MASIGLRVVDPSSNSLSLADTLAKGVFGDPEAVAKAQLMAAQLRAHDAYASKLGADTNLVNIKTHEEQALSDAQDAAARDTNNALVASVPQPVPVELPRPSSNFMGPMPGIVTPAAKNQYDANVRTARE